jgi:hypothetical protein
MDDLLELCKPISIPVEEWNETFKTSMEALMLNKHYMVIDQNPWASRLSIEVPKPGKVEIQLMSDTFSIHDDYGIWCNLIPMSIDPYKGEMRFRVNTYDSRANGDNLFIRTFKFLRSPSSEHWEKLEYLFRKMYQPPEPAEIKLEDISVKDGELCITCPEPSCPVNCAETATEEEPLLLDFALTVEVDGELSFETIKNRISSAIKYVDLNMTELNCTRYMYKGGEPVE